MSVDHDLNLLPQPASVSRAEGEFRLPPDLAISGPGEWSAVVRRLLGPGTGLELPNAENGALRLVPDDSLAAEGYRLSVRPDGIEIAAIDLGGVNWATQTLRQLLPASVLRPAPAGEALSVPCVEIEDAPRFGWRGVMLDVGRHFMAFAQLYDFVDLLAMHKYNVLHLHLTEDQGWRFESKTHPELNTAASVRAETQNHLWSTGDGTPHGGLYTQDQLRSLVRYAEQRGITIVPEIEFPGHVSAVLAAYPELSNDPGKTYAAATTFGVFDEVLNMSDEAMAFVYDIFEEVLDVFPSHYIHIGGDECPRTEWQDSVPAKQLAADRDLDNVDLLQNWFSEKMRVWLAERGRQLVGWDEINIGGVMDGATLMAWRDEKFGIEGAEAGQDVIMAPVNFTYFDYYPSNDDAEFYSIGGLITTEHAYSFDPLKGVPDAARSRVIGTQCQLWREYMHTTERVQYMLWPRGCAHSEVAWSSPDGRSWAEFSTRLAGHLARLDALGVNYRPEQGPLPWQQGGTGRYARPEAHRVTTAQDITTQD